MIDSFIPNEIAVAPNPLGLSPNLKLTTIPIDGSSQFELWMPLTGGTILLEEGVLLKGDRPRLEEICDRLVWLLGAHLIQPEQETHPYLHTSPIYDWGSVKQFLKQSGVAFNALGFSYMPQEICSSYSQTGGTTWMLYPASWTILLLNLQPAGKGFQVATLPVQVLLTMGECVSRQEKRTVVAVK